MTLSTKEGTFSTIDTQDLTAQALLEFNKRKDELSLSDYEKMFEQLIETPSGALMFLDQFNSNTRITGSGFSDALFCLDLREFTADGVYIGMVTSKATISRLIDVLNSINSYLGTYQFDNPTDTDEYYEMKLSVDILLEDNLTPADACKKLQLMNLSGEVTLDLEKFPSPDSTAYFDEITTNTTFGQIVEVINAANQYISQPENLELNTLSKYHKKLKDSVLALG